MPLLNRPYQGLNSLSSDEIVSDYKIQSILLTPYSTLFHFDKILGKYPHRLLDLYDIIFSRKLLSWKNSQIERKPDPQRVPYRHRLSKTHGLIQGSAGYFTQDSNRNSG